MCKDNRASPYRNPNKVYQVNQHQIECVFWKKSDHKSADCLKVKITSGKRKLLSEKKDVSIVLSQNIVPPTAVVQKHA